jgi:hypothetical protein
MQFKAFEPGIEVHGSSIDAVVEAFKLFPSIGLKRMATHGIGTANAKGEIVIDRDGWYSQTAWLAAFEAIATTVGTRALFQIGQHVPKHAIFPPQITDIRSGLASLDVAFHMNHRKDGRPMFDPASGRMTKGIGSYGMKDNGPRKVTCLCENPYPCDFDRGVITGVATRFERGARVTHDETGPCRKNGADSCTYHVTW